jgi:hypothetical protein
MRMVTRTKFFEDGLFFLELTFTFMSSLEECFDSYSWMLFLHKLSQNNKQQTHRYSPQVKILIPKSCDARDVYEML